MIVIGRLEGNGFYSSRELMEELIVAVQSLGQKGCFDYIQLGTTIISVLISVIAIIFAIRVPKQIADRQDRISLFEKRYKIYNLYADYYALTLRISCVENREEVQRNFLCTYYGAWNDSLLDNFEEISNKMKQIRFELLQSKFLFNKEIGSQISSVIEQLANVVDVSLKRDDELKLQEEQQKLRKEVRNPESIIVLKRMEEYLELN